MATPPTSRKNLLIPIAFLCVYIFWGSTFVGIRYAVRFVTPGFVSGFRYLIAGLILLAWTALRGRTVAISRYEFLRALGLGLLFLTCNNVLLGWGERYLSAGYAALLAASIPLMIAIAESTLANGTPLNRTGWIGTAVGLCGLALLLGPVLRNGLVNHTGDSADRALLYGTLILCFGNLFWVAGSLISPRRPSTLAPLLASAWQMVLAGTVNVLIGTVAGGWHTAHWTSGVLGALSWLAIFGSLVGYSAYTYLLHNVPVAKVATYAYVNPIVAVVLSAVFLHESLHGSQWIAMAIILGAVAIVTASKSKPVPAAAPKPD